MFEEKTGKKLEVNVGEGHNHVSAAMALNSGEGEQWGEDLAKWVKDNVSVFLFLFPVTPAET